MILCAEIMDFLAIPYCIVGGYAVACYGVPRQTGDVDVLAVIDGDAAVVAKKLKGLKTAPLDLSDIQSILKVESPDAEDLSCRIVQFKRLNTSQDRTAKENLLQ